MYIVTPLWPVTSQYSDTFYPSGLGQCALIEFARRLPLTSCHVGRFFYSIDPRDSHHLRRERVSIRSLVDLPPTTKRSDSVQRTWQTPKFFQRAREHTIFCVERPQQWPLLRSIRAMMGFVCGLPSAPARRTSCIVCRIAMGSSGHSTAARQTRTEKEREQPIESRPRTYREELERVRRHDAVVVVRRQQHGWRVLAAPAARVAAGSGGGRPLLLLLPRPPHVVEGGVPA